MKNIILTLQAILVYTVLQAQTWNGSVSNEWTNPLNWTPNTVPGATSSIVLGGTGFSPKLLANTTVGAINSTTPYTLDFNGFSLTVGGISANTVIDSATLINTNPGSDIVLNFVQISSVYAARLKGSVINDHITINVTGGNQPFYEGDTTNTFHGNVVFNLGFSGSAFIAYLSPGIYNGNVTINRTVAAATYCFKNGASIQGNLSYTKSVIGNSEFGSLSYRTTINGMVSMNITQNTASTFELYRLINQTSGGSISVQGTRMDIQNDTLKLNSLSVSGYGGSTHAYFYNNEITGNVNISDDPAYGSVYATYIRSNTIYGNTVLTFNGFNPVYEANTVGSANVYNGNVTINCNGTGSLFLSQASMSVFNGNLDIHRTAAGYTKAFNAGGLISGNFSFTKNGLSGATEFGVLTASTMIAGTININVSQTLSDAFVMYRIVNNTNGGNINVHTTRAFDCRNDTLKLVNMNISAFGGLADAYLVGNFIQGNFTASDTSAYASVYEIYVRNNTLNGNTTFTTHGDNPFFDAPAAGNANMFNGHVNYNCFGTGNCYISYGSASTYNGNLTINRTVAGITNVFNSGGTVNGNLSYTKNGPAGASDFGNPAFKTLITGTINIQVTQTTSNTFSMFWIVNNTPGGTINVQNTRLSITNDTLKLDSFIVNGYGGSANTTFYNNRIEGNITLSDHPAYGSSYATYIRSNTIYGNCSFTIGGFNPLYEADIANSANIFNGDVVYYGSGSGALYISHLSASTYNGNLNIIRTANGITKAFNGGCLINGNVSYIKNGFGGTSEFGTTANRTLISGQINMNIAQTVNDLFSLYWLVNQTAGGTIQVQPTRAYDFRNDTLKISEISIRGYAGSSYAYLMNSLLEGNFLSSDSSIYGSVYSTNIRNNTITGNCTFYNNGTNPFNDGEGAGFGNTYLGNVMYIRNNSSMNVGTADTNSYAGNLLFNNSSSLPINAGTLRMTGNAAQTINQLGNGSIAITKLIMDKSLGSGITLAKPVRITSNCTFLSGLIYSNSNNPLLFQDNATATSASDNSHVVGCVSKAGNDAFTFPLGNGIGLNTIGISAPDITTDTFTACIILKDPTVDGYNLASRDASLLQMQPYHYWTLSRTPGTSAENISIGWGNPCVNAGITNLPSLAIARWNTSGSTWNNLGNTSPTGTNASGTITTPISTNSFGVFTLGSTSNLNMWPVTTASVSNPVICQGASTTLSSTGASTYLWQPGSLIGSTVVVSPSVTTTYTVYGTSATGCVTTATRTVTVNPLPPTSTSVTSSAICIGNSTTITGTGANSYTWLPGNLSGTAITVSPAATTTYTVTGTITATGCTATATRTITVNPLPNTSTTVSQPVICLGQSTVITGNGANTYTWIPGGIGGSSINVSPAATTTYTVTGTITATGCSATATRIITVNSLPAVGTSVSAATICQGASTTITGNGANTYTWMPGSLSGTSVTVSPAATTTYTVTGTNTSTGCSATATRIITVNSLTAVGTSVSTATICQGASTTITGNGANTYTWMPGSLSGTSVTVSPATTTTYTVTGTNTSTGCSATATRTITVNSCNSIVNLKLFIEGYYIGSGSMAPVLTLQGVSTNSTLTDTITVELRQAFTPYAVAASLKVLLGTTGMATCIFPAINGNYYLVVKHRNALQTWSSSPVAVSTLNPLSYDFTTSQSKAFGSNQVLVSSGPNVYAFYSGDINQDENMDLIDNSEIEAGIINFDFGYYATDINGDGNVDLSDTPILENNINNFIFSIHP